MILVFCVWEVIRIILCGRGPFAEEGETPSLTDTLPCIMLLSESTEVQIHVSVGILGALGSIGKLSNFECLGRRGAPLRSYPRGTKCLCNSSSCSIGDPFRCCVCDIFNGSICWLRNFVACHKSQITFNFLKQKTIWGSLGHRGRGGFHVWRMGPRPRVWGGK